MSSHSHVDSVTHVQRMLNSFLRWLKRDLIVRDGSVHEQAERLFQAPFVVVSHGTQTDPILCYGNARALQLWELSWEELTAMPSRLTAEPMHRDERAQLLARTTRDGYVDDYRGIRISKSGRRFRIAQAIVWNVIDEQGMYCGQAAMFSQWEYL
jgi:MEKHLA domain